MTGVIDPRVSLRSTELPKLGKPDYLDCLANLSYRVQPLSAATLGIGIACLAVATGLRFAVGWSESDVRYAIFLSAMATGLLAGARVAAGVMIGPIFIVGWAFMPPYFAFKPLTSLELMTALWSSFSGLCKIRFAQGCRTVLNGLQAHQLKNGILVSELAHRGRNIFVVIEIILQKTLASDRRQADALLGRLRAVRYANELPTGTPDQSTHRCVRQSAFGNCNLISRRRASPVR